MSNTQKEVNGQVVENTKTEVVEATSERLPTLLKFEVTKIVTMPLLKMFNNVPIYVQIQDVMFVGKEIKGTGEKAKMEPATLVNCINLETGEPCQIIIATVLKSVLNENYENGDYVGKQFQITKGAKSEGKGYNPYMVQEIKVG